MALIINTYEKKYLHKTQDRFCNTYTKNTWQTLTVKAYVKMSIKTVCPQKGGGGGGSTKLEWGQANIEPNIHLLSLEVERGGQWVQIWFYINSVPSCPNKKDQ